MPASIELLLVCLFPSVPATDLTASVSALLVPLMPFGSTVFVPMSADPSSVFVFALMFHYNHRTNYGASACVIPQGETTANR
jgi:hypothetical protein